MTTRHPDYTDEYSRLDEALFYWRCRLYIRFPGKDGTDTLVRHLLTLKEFVVETRDL